MVTTRPGTAIRAVPKRFQLPRWLATSCVLGLAIVLHWLLLPAAPAAAQTNSLYARRFEVVLSLEPAGSLLVTETQEVVFPSTHRFSTGFREIPLERVERIADIRLEEPGQPYRHAGGPLEASRAGGGGLPAPAEPTAPQTFVTSVQDGRLRITWRFPDTRGQARTFLLSYRVYGGIRVYPDGNQLYWKAIYADRPYPIETASVRVQFPLPVTLAELQWAVSPARLQVRVEQPDASSIRFQTLHGLAANEELEVRVQFPHGLVQAQPPAWQPQADQQEYYDQHTRPLLNFGLGLLTLLIGLAGSLGVFLAWYVRGRDPVIGQVPPVLEEPPSDLPPGLVGTLVDQKADVQDAVATLLDLAQRGVLRITEEPSVPGKRRDYRLTLIPMDPAPDLHPLERACGSVRSSVAPSYLILPAHVLPPYLPMSLCLDHRPPASQRDASPPFPLPSKTRT